MKAKQLFSICAVLSPIVIASTFSVQALSAEPIMIYEMDHQAQMDFNNAELEAIKSEVPSFDKNELDAMVAANLDSTNESVTVSTQAKIELASTNKGRSIGETQQPQAIDQAKRDIAADHSNDESNNSQPEIALTQAEVKTKDQPKVVLGAAKPLPKFNEVIIQNMDSQVTAASESEESIEDKLKKDRGAITQKNKQKDFEQIAQLQNPEASESEQAPEESMEDKLKKDQDAISQKNKQKDFEQIAQLQTPEASESEQAPTEAIDLDALLEKSNDVIAQIDAALGIEVKSDEFKEIDFDKLFEMSDDVVIQYDSLPLKVKTEEVTELEKEVKDKIEELKKRKEDKKVAIKDDAKEDKKEEKEEEKEEENVNDKIAELQKEIEELQKENKKKDTYVGKLEKAYCSVSSTPTSLDGFMKMQMMQMAQTSQLIQLLTAQMIQSSKLQMNYGMDGQFAKGYFQARQDFGLGQQNGARQDQYGPLSMAGTTTNNYYINRQDPFTTYGADTRLTTNSELPQFGFDFTQTLPNQDRFSQMNGQNSNVQRNLSGMTNTQSTQNAQNVDWLNVDLNSVLFNNQQSNSRF